MLLEGPGADEGDATGGSLTPAGSTRKSKKSSRKAKASKRASKLANHDTDTPEADGADPAAADEAKGCCCVIS